MTAPLVRLHINQRAVDVTEGSSVAAAIARHASLFRRSITGQPRAAFCGMGVCFECRVSIDGIGQQRACMVTVREGMQVISDE
jgi:sarcosine oxidase subunit alpha